MASSGFQADVKALQKVLSARHLKWTLEALITLSHFTVQLVVLMNILSTHGVLEQCKFEHDGWNHQVGIQGEKLEIYTDLGSKKVKWTDVQGPAQGLRWYKV
ncbi:beta-galactosidase [Stylosanthes scabra]|uniref:Beta-galactosidase n=1 Tax=Stylosanthes scabra TaxID=79078 RepID=A0ABU6XJX7_9FABA|nr:beta-galactosidase [Stylosanthes scabra]